MKKHRNLLNYVLRHSRKKRKPIVQYVHIIDKYFSNKTTSKYKRSRTIKSNRSV